MPSNDGRVWVDWYNRPRVFSNGIVWFRVSVRLRRWHRVGGLWFSQSWPFFKVLLPWGGSKGGPIHRV